MTRPVPRIGPPSPRATADRVDVAGKLRELANRIDWLAPTHGDPERFHLDKSEIAFELRTMAARVRGTTI